MLKGFPEMAAQKPKIANPTIDDGRNLSWYVDKLMQLVIFIGGFSAIVFVVSIFVFITKEGWGFLVDHFDAMLE